MKTLAILALVCGTALAEVFFEERFDKGKNSSNFFELHFLRIDEHRSNSKCNEIRM